MEIEKERQKKDSEKVLDKESRLLGIGLKIKEEKK